MPRKKKVGPVTTPEQEVEAVVGPTPDLADAPHSPDEMFEAERDVAAALGEIDPLELPTFPERAISRWTTEQLQRVKHLGPAIIGKEMHAAAQALAAVPGQGKLGPALLDPDHAAKQAAKPAAE